MDPLLRRVEALPEDGSYSLSFVLSDGAERTLLVRASGRRSETADFAVPEANLIPGWSSTSASFLAAIAAVRALHDARRAAGTQGARLRDVPGGWDVGLGNVTLSEAGLPVCASHGDMESTSADQFRCVECGSMAVYGEDSDDDSQV